MYSFWNVVGKNTESSFFKLFSRIKNVKMKQQHRCRGRTAQSDTMWTEKLWLTSFSLCRKLQFQCLSAEVPVLFRVVELPKKHHLCKVKSLNKGDANSEVTVYYQVGAAGHVWRFLGHFCLPSFILLKAQFTKWCPNLKKNATVVSGWYLQVQPDISGTCSQYDVHSSVISSHCVLN